MLSAEHEHVHSPSIEVKLVVVGAAKVGKTSILRQFLHNQFSYSYEATVEEIFHRKYLINEQLFDVEFLDTSGSYDFPAMRRLAMHRATAYLLVFSLTDSVSLDRLNEMLQYIEEDREKRKSPTCPLVVAANKLDLVASRVVSEDAAEEWTKAHNLPSKSLIYTSAKDEDGIWDIFARLWENYQELTKYEKVMNDLGHLSVLESPRLSSSETGSDSTMMGTTRASSRSPHFVPSPHQKSPATQKSHRFRHFIPRKSTSMASSSSSSKETNDDTKRRFSAFAILSAASSALGPNLHILRRSVMRQHSMSAAVTSPLRKLAQAKRGSSSVAALGKPNSAQPRTSYSPHNSSLTQKVHRLDCCIS